jgi:hypothetical protein
MERYALAVLYYATDGDGWSNNSGWLTDVSVCTWQGITCADSLVTKIELWTWGGASYGLTGNLPDEMRLLTNLEHLRLSYNRYIGGSIPTFLPALTKLTYLNLGMSTHT